MNDMTKAGAHAKEAGRRDHLWVLFVIAGCALTEVFASWVLIGGMSGFPKIGGEHGVPTDWTLAVTSEAYWGYALYSWLAGAPGPRSRRFAMWSFGAVFILSLIGQGASHLVPPGAKPSAVLVVFVTSLPVLVLALIAVLIHLRQIDREEAAEAAEESALQGALDAARAARDAAQEELASARAELAEVTAAAEALTRKLAAATARNSGRGSGSKKTGTRNRNRNPEPARSSAAEPVPDEPLSIEAEARILELTGQGRTPSEARVLALMEEGNTASKAGVLAGFSDSYGRQVARLAKPGKKEPAGDERTDGDMATGEQSAITEHTEG